MPAPVALPLGLALGSLFAWISRHDLRKGALAEGTARGLGVATLFGLLVFAPVCGYFLAFEPDWSFAYFLDFTALSPALLPATLVLEAFSVPIGFLIAARFARSGEPRRVVRWGACALLLAVSVVLALLRRFAIHATYAQYHGDFGTLRLAGSSLGYAVLALGFWLSCGVVFATFCLRRPQTGA